MSRKVARFYRKLDKDDLVRMKIPERHWSADLDRIADDDGVMGSESTKEVIEKYMRNMDAMRHRGCGLVLWGKNGNGKTSAAVVVAKEFRRCGHTVLFLEAASMKRVVIGNEYFDEDESWWSRICEVDMLVIDDFGKGVMDGKGFGPSLFDEIVRTRNAHKKITFITSNLNPAEWVFELELKTSTIETLKECMIPVHADGRNQRNDTRDGLVELLKS